MRNPGWITTYQAELKRQRLPGSRQKVLRTVKEQIRLGLVPDEWRFNYKSRDPRRTFNKRRLRRIKVERGIDRRALRALGKALGISLGGGPLIVEALQPLGPWRHYVEIIDDPELGPVTFGSFQRDPIMESALLAQATRGRSELLNIDAPASAPKKFPSLNDTLPLAWDDPDGRQSHIKDKEK